ncbi:MAG: cell division protein FtsA [Pseudomonadota bacterium]
MKPKKATQFEPRGSVIAALDIGSHKISCFIAQVIDDDGGLEVVGVGYQASKGIKNGVIVDIDAADKAIRNTVHTAEKMAAEIMKGYPLRDIVVCVPGLQTSSHNFTVDIQIAGQEITDMDVKRALAKAQDQVLREDQELIHTIAVNAIIDGNSGIVDPRGMTGDTLEVNIHIVTGDLSSLQNMASCIGRSHLDIVSLVSAPYAAGLASLVEDEMDLGCTVIDMGAGMTSFAVFQSGQMIYSDSVPVGGAHVTNDIACGLTCSHADAERFKTLYGSAIVSASDDNEIIEVARLGESEEDSHHSVTRSFLIGIIQPRLEEIFELVKGKLDSSDLGDNLGRRVVLTGGASQLPSMRDLAQQLLDKQVRLGRPIRLSGLPDAVSGPAFSTTAGLLEYVATRAHEMPAEIIESVDSGSLWEKFSRWWRENW